MGAPHGNEAFVFQGLFVGLARVVAATLSLSERRSVGPLAKWL